ncbi:hypothetical protein LTR94_038260, partial [Friedmanniomyces endolithicus]
RGRQCRADPRRDRRHVYRRRHRAAPGPRLRTIGVPRALRRQGAPRRLSVAYPDLPDHRTVSRFARGFGYAVGSRPYSAI